MKARIRLLALLLVALVAAGSPARALRAQTPSDGQLGVVQAAYDNLMNLFYRPLDPVTLLTAAWTGLTTQAQSDGLPAPAALGQIPDTHDDAFSAFSTAFNAYLVGLPAASVSSANLGFAAARAMVSSLNDDHTAFLSPSAYNDFLSELGGGSAPVGTGVETTTTAPWVVIDVAPNGPAASAGVQPGDEVTAVDGSSVSGAGLQEFTSATGGPAGTSHVLTLDRQGQSLTVTVTAGIYYFPPLSSRMLPGNIGYIAVQHFADDGLTLPDGTEIMSDFDRRLNALNAAGATGLILDLRDDPGGDVLTAEEMLGRFLPANTETVIRYDERGHQATGVVAGPMNPQQLPMAVLVNAGSASSSELVAATLKEAGRAILVGQRTAGALETSEILPLPEGAGLQVDVAEQVTAGTHYMIDGQGYPVDVPVPDTRTAADYRSGNDPQLQAAVQALAQAPVPPAPEAASSTTKQQLVNLLSGYMPPAAQIPTNSRLTSAVDTEALALNEPNEWLDAFGFGGRDPHAGQATLARRSWLGSYDQNYSPAPLVPPTVSVDIDLYATDTGAEDALTTNDFPDEQTLGPSPVQLGDGAIETDGIWMDLGSESISWRHGNVVLNVGYGDVPGFVDTDTLVAAAKLVDQIYEQHPLPHDLAGALSGASPAPAAPPASSYRHACSGQTGPLLKSCDSALRVEAFGRVRLYWLPVAPFIAWTRR
jgi:carboxyl-terminal processing protease